MRDLVENFLHEHFAGMRVDFGPPQIEGGRLSGVLVYDGFNDRPVAQRQSLVWDALRERFGAQAVHISTLVTLTPEQYEALDSED
jgi:acid stress-induced BolA-like protein IbaG/YrbA